MDRLTGAELHRLERWLVREIGTSSYRAARIASYVSERFAAKNKVSDSSVSRSVNPADCGNLGAEPHRLRFWARRRAGGKMGPGGRRRKSD